MAAALTVAPGPVPASSIGHHDVSISRYSSSTLSLQDVKESVAFLPIGEATSYMLNLADRMKIHRANHGKWRAVTKRIWQRGTAGK